MYFAPIQLKNTNGLLGLFQRNAFHWGCTLTSKRSMHEELQNKLDCDEQIKEIKSQLENKSVKLKDLQAKLHRTKECIRQRKRKINGRDMVKSQKFSLVSLLR